MRSQGSGTRSYTACMIWHARQRNNFNAKQLFWHDLIIPTCRKSRIILRLMTAIIWSWTMSRVKTSAPLMLSAKQEGTFLPEKDVLVWVGQISDALTYLHTQQPPILHRDIKPSNVKVTPSGLIKLVDFGLVKVLAPGEVTITVLQGQGTALYTPLEQYGGDSGHTDIRSDIYALAATFYHLVTNQPPPDARDRFLRPGCSY